MTMHWIQPQMLHVWQRLLCFFITIVNQDSSHLKGLIAASTRVPRSCLATIHKAEAALHVDMCPLPYQGPPFLTASCSSGFYHFRSLPGPQDI